MKKEVKRYGNSVIVVFNKEEQKIYNIKVGDIIDIEISRTEQPLDLP